MWRRPLSTVLSRFVSEAAGLFHFLVPGSIQRRTGGSIYDRRIAEALQATGWHPRIEELDGAFPVADDASKAACRALFDRLVDDARLLVDGLVLPAMSHLLTDRPTSCTVILCHHPVVLESGWSDNELAALRQREAEGFAHASMVIAPSRRTLTDIAALGYPLKDGRHVHPGSDPVSPAPEIRTTVGRPARLLCVANLAPRKGHDVLLEAMVQLADLDLHLTCVGAGSAAPEYANDIKEMAGRPQLEGRVSFTGDISPAELDAEYAAADIFVLASRHEGFGMVLSEAVRRGLPLVATRAGAIPEAAPAAATSLVPPDDPAALAAAIRELVTNPAAYSARGAAAHAAAWDLPDWTEAADKFAEALDKAWGRDE